MKRTWGYIKSECINLGFDKAKVYQKNPSIFVEAANRALIEIATAVMPILDKFTITHNPLLNLVADSGVKAYLGKKIIYKASGVKAYSFECDGRGTAIISNGVDADTVITLNANKRFTAYKGFKSGDVTITFSGDYAYQIRSVAMFGILNGNSIDDIPIQQPFVQYDLAKLTAVDNEEVFYDFFEERPLINTADGGKIVSDYKRFGKSILAFNSSNVGEYEVWYKKYPKKITEATADDYEIELDYDAYMLLPLLMGFYIWLDDDNGTLARTYQNDYEDKKLRVMARMRGYKIANVEIKNERRWG